VVNQKVLLVNLLTAGAVLCSIGTANPLDPTFGRNGVRDIETAGVFDDLSPKAIAVQTDGTIVVAGSRRVSSNDQAFVSILWQPNGFAQYNFGIDMFAGLEHDATSLALDREGRIRVGGSVVLPIRTCDHIDRYTSYSFVSRFDSKGSIDTSFGPSGSFAGSALIQAPCADVLDVLASVDAAGRTLVSSDVLDGGVTSIVVTRLSEDGKIDSSFGTSGQIRMQAPAGDSLAAAGLATSKSGEVFVGANQTSSIDGSVKGSVFKFRSDGNPDSTFGAGGAVVVDLSSASERLCCMAVDGQGRTYIAGTSNEEFAFIARLTPAGQFDAKFGTHGVAFMSVGTSDSPAALALDASDRANVTLTSYGLHSGATAIELLHFNEDGSLNFATGESGIYEQSCGFIDCTAAGLAVDAFGRPTMVVASPDNGTFVLREDELFADGCD